jgi:hypothetical protein
VVVNLIYFLTPPHVMLFIEEAMPSLGSKISCICVLGARVCSNLSCFYWLFELFRECGIFFHFIIDTQRIYYRYTKKKYKIIDVVWLCSMNPSTIECLAPTTFTMRTSPPPPPVINQSSRYKLKLLRHLMKWDTNIFL